MLLLYEFATEIVNKCIKKKISKIYCAFYIGYYNYFYSEKTMKKKMYVYKYGDKNNLKEVIHERNNKIIKNYTFVGTNLLVSNYEVQ